MTTDHQDSLVGLDSQATQEPKDRRVNQGTQASMGTKARQETQVMLVKEHRDPLVPPGMMDFKESKATGVFPGWKGTPVARDRRVSGETMAYRDNQDSRAWMVNLVPQEYLAEMVSLDPMEGKVKLVIQDHLDPQEDMANRGYLASLASKEKLETQAGQASQATLGDTGSKDSLVSPGSADRRDPRDEALSVEHTGMTECQDFQVNLVYLDSLDIQGLLAPKERLGTQAMY